MGGRHAATTQLTGDFKERSVVLEPSPLPSPTPLGRVCLFLSKERKKTDNPSGVPVCV